MVIDSYEAVLLEAFYDYHRIPLWIFDEKVMLQDSFFTAAAKNSEVILSAHMAAIAGRMIPKAFDILSYDNELYFCFSFSENRKTLYLIGGPILLSGFYHPAAIRNLSFAAHMNRTEAEQLIETLPVLSFTSFCSALRMLMLLLTKQAPTIDEIRSYQNPEHKDSTYGSYVYELFENREDAREHTPYSQELAILHCVREGNYQQLEATFKALPETKYGKMSDNPLRQLFYGCITSTTLVTRYAIEGGMDEEAAFTLSDVYIKKMENCRSLFELHMLNEKMVVDFTTEVAKAKERAQITYIEPVQQCIDYIFLNLHQKISLELLSKQVNLTPKYLSNLFHKETGKTLSSFIEEKRIEESKNMLIYSRYSYSQISSYLSFNSHSYFTSVFKKNTGMTPKEFRRRFSRSCWEVKS